MEPKYHYNIRLGKCLYSGGYRNANSEALSFSDPDFAIKVKSLDYYWERIVKDVYTNETIVSVYNFQSAEIITVKEKEMDGLMSN